MTGSRIGVDVRDSEENQRNKETQPDTLRSLDKSLLGAVRSGCLSGFVVSSLVEDSVVELLLVPVGHLHLDVYVPAQSRANGKHRRGSPQRRTDLSRDKKKKSSFRERRIQGQGRLPAKTGRTR